MRGTLLRRLALSAGGALLALPLAPSVASAAPATGTISGTITSGGSAASGVFVQLYQFETYEFVQYVETDESGAYRLTGVPAGSYLIGFESGFTPTQYAHQRREIFDADEIVVTAGGTTTVNEALLPTAVIRGRVLQADGQPAADLNVAATGSDGDSGGITDADGRYEFRVFPGTYTLVFNLGQWDSPDGVIRQYHPGKINSADATPVVAAAGQELTVDETLLPVGSVSGRLLRQGGAPEPNASVELLASDSETAVYTQTDAAGRFRVPQAFAGSYRLHYSDSEGAHSQYYRGKTSFEESDPVVVTGGADTAVEDTWLPTGSVRVTAKDQRTGAAIADFCTYAGPDARGGCSDGTGVVTITDLLPGTYPIFVTANDGAHLFTTSAPVQVMANQTASVQVAMKPAARISVTAVDRQTGKPVADVCVSDITDNRPWPPDGAWCTDSQGKVTLGYLEGGKYRLFARPQPDSPYGMQWVGASGGTGDQAEAAVVFAPAGAITTAPVIRLDRKGTISGRITEQDGTTGVAGGLVSLFTFHPASGPSDSVDTDATGRYTMTGLGPYQWPLFITAAGHPSVWSGGVGDRRSATKVKVTAGATATYNTAIKADASVIRGTVKDRRGTAFDNGWVVIYNTATWDVVGSAELINGAYSVKVIGNQSVYVGYDVYTGESSYRGYYVGRVGRGPTTPQKIPPMPGAAAATRTGLRGPAPVPQKPVATPVAVPAAGTLTVNLVVPTP